jgi:hypothetical protein
MLHGAQKTWSANTVPGTQQHYPDLHLPRIKRDEADVCIFEKLMDNS